LTSSDGPEGDREGKRSCSCTKKRRRMFEPPVGGGPKREIPTIRSSTGNKAFARSHAALSGRREKKGTFTCRIRAGQGGWEKKAVSHPKRTPSPHDDDRNCGNSGRTEKKNLTSAVGGVCRRGGQRKSAPLSHYYPDGFFFGFWGVLGFYVSGGGVFAVGERGGHKSGEETSSSTTGPTAQKKLRQASRRRAVWKEVNRLEAAEKKERFPKRSTPEGTRAL